MQRRTKRNNYLAADGNRDGRDPEARVPVDGLGWVERKARDSCSNVQQTGQQHLTAGLDDF